MVYYFQDIISVLQRFWSENGCVILQPYDTEMEQELSTGPLLLRLLAAKVGMYALPSLVVVQPMADMEKTPIVYNIFIKCKFC